MSILRVVLLAVIAWLAFRIFRSFMNLKRTTGPEEEVGTTPPDPAAPLPPDDFLEENIRDAQFEDLESPPERLPEEPPKSS